MAGHPQLVQERLGGSVPRQGAHGLLSPDSGSSDSHLLPAAVTCPPHREYRACGPAEEPSCESSLVAIRCAGTAGWPLRLCAGVVGAVWALGSPVPVPQPMHTHHLMPSRPQTPRAEEHPPGGRLLLSRGHHELRPRIRRLRGAVWYAARLCCSVKPTPVLRHQDSANGLVFSPFQAAWGLTMCLER